MLILNPLALLPLLSVLITPTLSQKLTITITPSTHLPNPHALPADTHATLTSAALSAPLKAPLTSSATFVFPSLNSSTASEYKIPHKDDISGSYLLDIRSSEYVFAPLRVDVDASGFVVGVWETFRGNEWGNRGVEKFRVAGDTGSKEDVVVDVKVMGRKGFYEARQTFSPLSLLKNPMILLALVALGFTFGMPKLMENMDPEMRAEFEKQSRSSPISGAQSAMAGGGAGNFDLAGWMAGAAPRGATPVSGAGAGAASAREQRGGARRR
ncbi:hypothetical protein ASPCAL02591 [Aspergillus calidoustus]|uniref:ER membrane protein complex subunit 7 beta-sandwich domain-containing protein n=1 Tax=Aspergillus calidoustus TaxID=454130 RepID=A0A0U5GQP5_ASPCI|nr:hypothetical protein ASPCAL02591 [Aspergillus calidoustus]